MARSRRTQPSEMHKSLSKFIADTEGKKITPAQVQMVLRAYPEFLKTEEHVEAQAALRAEREERAEAKRQRRIERARTRLAKIEEQRARLLAEAGQVEAEVDAEVAFDSDPVALPENYVGSEPGESVDPEPVEAEVTEAEDGFEDADEDDEF